MTEEERVEKTTEQLLAAALSHPYREAKTIPYTGFCLNDCCEQKLPAPMRWCNSACRKAWEQEQRYVNPQT